jgi:hypothetical protein
MFLNDEDIESLVKKLWRPVGGGVIDGPAIVGGAAQGNLGHLVANPGHYVSIMAEPISG